MKPNEGKSNENIIELSEEPSTSSTQDKTKLKRRIVNQFKRLSLKRTKSYGTQYNLFNEESDLSIQKDNLKFENPEEHIYSQNVIEETHQVYAETNPFNYQPIVPYSTACTSHTVSQSIFIIPNDTTDQSTNYDLTQSEYTEDKPVNLVFDISDLPAVSDMSRNMNTPPVTSNVENANCPRSIINSKSSQTNKIKNIEKKIKTSVNEICNIVPTNFLSLPDDSSNVNINLSLGLKEVLDIANYCQENELHLKHLLSKYIRDANLQKELVQAVSCHAKVQIENERRAHKLAHEMFVQESEAQKTKEKALQKSLDVVVQINRVLEEEIENLKNEHEKIIVEYDNESSSCAYHKKYEEDILKNNSELRSRLKYLLSEIKKFETNLKKLQSQNGCLVNELANANTQIRSYKDMLQKSMGDHEIAEATLMQQLENQEQILKASIDAGDTLMEDLEAIKRQLKQMPFTLNWSKFKCRGDTVVDLLHLSRSCINELCRELINTYMQSSFRKKDSESQNVEINKLNQELHQAKTNDLQLQSKVKGLSSLEIQLQVQVQKVSILESELEMYKKDNSAMADRFYEEKNKVKNLMTDIEHYNTQLSAKDLDISALHTKIYDIITHNSTLKCQLDSMKKLLDESRLSQVLSELLETQEKCAYYQAQYYQMELERNNFIELSKKFNVERENLIKYQQSYYEHLKLQQKDISDLNRQNKELKEQLKLQEENLLDKSTQLVQQIQESNIMKTVQSQFTSEVSKNNLLESNALNTNFEVNRLSVVAEYNNMISLQLKQAINHKDNIILELKSSLEKLSNAEKKSTEDKAALCHELTEASCMIKQLKNDLKNEQGKIKLISSEKLKLQKDAEKQTEELHKLLIDERHAARELIKDHKNLVTQRNNLLSQQKEYLAQIETLRENENKLKLVREQYETKCHKYEEQCEILTKDLREATKTIELKQQKAKNDAVEYENKLSSRDHIIEKVKYEKEELENTIKYLQNNIHKLQTDLDVLRNIERDYKDQLASSFESLSKFQERTDEQRKILEQCSSEQKILEQKLNEALLCNNELLNEYNSFMKDTRTREEKLQNEIKSYKKLNETKSKSIECLALDSKAKFKLLERRQSEYNSLKESLQNFEHIQKTLDEKSRLLEHSLDSQHKLNEKILRLIPENENSQKKLKEYSNIINILQSQLEISTKNREKEIETCRNFMEELTNEIKNQKQEMLNDLNNLTAKLNELNSKYIEKSVKYETLKSDYKDLAQQLSKAVNTLIEEKIFRKNKEADIELLKNEIQELKSRLEYTNNYMNEINEIKLKAESIFDKDDSLQNELEETKKLYSAAQDDCKTLETQLKETTEKLRKLEQFSEIEEGYAMNELKEQSNLLKKSENNVEILETRVKKLRFQMQSTNDVIVQLKSEISILYQKIQILEFQKCELTLRYHELNGKYLAEKNLNATLKESHQHLLASVCELNRDEPMPVTQSAPQSMMLTLK